jgi:flagellar biosynthetic protein FliR
MMGLDFGFGAVEAELWRLLFAMTRIGAALLAVPLFGAVAVPAQVRVMLAGAIGVLVCAWTPLTVPPALFTLAGLLAVLGEVLVGLALGFTLQLAFAAPVIAAEVIGGAMGMSIATAADPASGAHSPVLGQYFTVLMTLVFLGVGAHLQWFALLVESYTAFPPGQTWLGAARLEGLTAFAATMFATGLAIALPVTLVLLLAQVLTGVLSRSAPALNLFALGLPLGVLTGLVALIAGAPLAADRLAGLVADGIAATAGLLAR